MVLAIALAVDLTQYENFLFLAGSLFTLLFGVLFADYFLLHRRRRQTADFYPTPEAGTSGVKITALLAWGAGIASYLSVISFAPWLGGTLPALAASLLVYLALARLRGPRSR